MIGSNLPAGRRNNLMMNTSVSLGNPFYRSMLLITGMAVLVLLPGCGGGGNSFTGGGFPIGRAALVGRAVRADNPLLPVPNATLTITSQTDGSSAQTRQAVTADDGSFAIPDMPVGAVSSTLTVNTTTQNTSLQSQQVTFLLRNGGNSSLIIALPPVGADITRAASVTLSPGIFSAQLNQTIAFKAQLYDESGDLLPWMPTLLFDGSVGTINSDGTFYATQSGSGSVIALWYNHLRSNTMVIQVQQPVSNTDIPPPPAPPQLPADTNVKSSEQSKAARIQR